VNDNPLVVPANKTLCLREDRRGGRALLPEPIHGAVVELEDREVKLGYQGVDVVARVTNQGTSLPVPRQVVLSAGVVHAQQKLVHIPKFVQMRHGVPGEKWRRNAEK